MRTLTELFFAGEANRRIVSKADYRPFPDIGQRNEWEGLSAELRQLIIAEGETYLGFEWPLLTAAMHREFLLNGNRTRFDEPYHKRRRAVTSLALAECVEDKGRFLPDLVNGIWLISEETSWVTSAHNRMFQSVSPDLPDVDDEPGIDLFAAETGNLFAWLHRLLGPALDQVNPLINKRIVRELKRRILDPYLRRDDCWWMGLRERDKRLNNWTPWCTSNCLSAFLLVEEDEERRLQAVRKAIGSIDRYLSMHPADGGCDEGPGYWNKAGGSLFDCLELLRAASGDAFNPYGEPLIQNIGRYIYRAHIHDRYFLNFADGPHQITIEPSLVYRYGEAIRDDNMVALGASFQRMLGAKGWNRMKFLSFLRVLPALFGYNAIKSDPRPMEFRLQTWMEGIQVMAARETAASDRGLYVAMKGGHNLESHNHNDIGHFVLYADGLPVLIDVGVEEYTAKTFSEQRYDIWTMQSGYHSVPTVNGFMQRDGRSYRATEAQCEMNEDSAHLVLNIADAFPPEAGLAAWYRTCRLRRRPQPVIELIEQYEFREGADCRFTLHYMTCCEPDLEQQGLIALRRGGQAVLHMEYDATRVTAEAETITLTDKKLRHAWGECLYRLVLTPKQMDRSGTQSVRFRQA